LNELDKLYNENDILKEKVNTFNTQFDFQQIEKNTITLEQLDGWAHKIKSWSEKLYLLLKD